MQPITRLATSARHRISMLLPPGRPLADVVWHRRHRAVCVLLAAHLPVLVAWSTLADHALAHQIVDVAPVALCAVLACRLRDQVQQSIMATLGLMSCSAVLVHLGHGVVEMHFHYFVMVGVITLYQRREPFVVGVTYVVLQHTVVGMLHPAAVYGAGPETHHPFVWAAVHGGFIVAASAVHVVSWHLNETQAQTDPLTGLANRAALVERLEQLLTPEATARIGVATLGLDRFRAINETHGQQVGDRVLDEIGHRLEREVRANDLVARLSGDEFCVLLSVESPERLDRATERLLGVVGQPVTIDGRSIFVTASVGSVFVDDPRSASDVLRDADLAMSLAKARGGDRVQAFRDDLGHEAREHAALESALCAAVEQDRISVVVQPVVDIADGSVHGAEVLARWYDEQRGPVPPCTFIPIAETSGLMPQLGRSVLRRACALAAEFDARHPGFVVHVNVSAQQLADPGFPDEVLSFLDEARCPRSALTLELTESVLVVDIERANERLGYLRAHGVRVAIDDFGTGYSSLSYLRHLPADVVKIDKTFIDNLDDSDGRDGGAADGTGIEVLAAIIMLAGTLGLEVVAEGIETATQAAVLERLGCRLGQGFLFAKPMPVEELLALVDQRPRATLQSTAPGSTLRP